MYIQMSLWEYPYTAGNPIQGYTVPLDRSPPMEGYIYIERPLYRATRYRCSHI